MNFSHSYALKCAAACVLAALAGCGPKDGVRELTEGTTALEAGDYVKAGKLLAKSVEYAPNRVEALVKLARVKLAVGEIAEAANCIDRAAQLDDEAVDIKLLGAQIAYHAKDYQKARALFGKVADDAVVEAADRANAFVGLGIVAMTANENDAARVAFMKALRLDRRCAAAYYHLGLLYRNAFDYADAALEQFEKFAYLGDGADPRVHKVQHVIIRDLKDAIARTAKSRPGASRRDSSACSALMQKAEAALKKGGTKDVRNAVDLYRKALVADPLSYSAALGLAKAQQRADASKEGLVKSLESYKIACMLKPTSVQTFMTAAALATRLGYGLQAVEAYSRALAVDEANISALDGYIRALQKLGGRRNVAALYQGYRDFLSSARKAEKK